jgi:ABC-type uncharacterized transport system permease subunit
MIAIAHFVAISLYVGAAALAATPIARPVRAPFRSVLLTLAGAVAAHGVAIGAAWIQDGQLPVVGLGPALSVAGFFVGATLLVVEFTAQEVSLSILAAPLAALITTVANVVGVAASPSLGAHSAWLDSHIALSFLGLAAFATAAAAGTMYLVEHNELKSRRLGAVFRMFPPLQTLDRVNHLAALAAWVALTMGVSLAFAYAINYNMLYVPKMLWAVAAWVTVTFAVVARMLLKWSAYRSAMFAGISFAAIIALYLVVRLSTAAGTGFL